MTTKRVNAAARDGKPPEPKKARKAPRKRLCLRGYLVQPLLVWATDGSSEAQDQHFDAQFVSSEEWAAFPADLEKALKGLEKKANE